MGAQGFFKVLASYIGEFPTDAIPPDAAAPLDGSGAIHTLLTRHAQPIMEV